MVIIISLFENAMFASGRRRPFSQSFLRVSCADGNRAQLAMYLVSKYGKCATPHLMRLCHNFLKARQLGASETAAAETNFSLAD